MERKSTEKLRFNWSAVAGHEQAKFFLENAILTNKLSHAYLFTGPAHIGKTTLALELGKILNCSGSRRPCGNCRACTGGLINYSLQLIDQETPIKVEQVRELKNKFSLKGFAGIFKIGIISQAENLTPEAGNALLKMLEEPGDRTVFILTSPQPNSLPQTIISRMQRIRLRPLSKDKVEGFLKSQQAKLSSDKRNELATNSFGRVGLAKRFLGDEVFYAEWKESLSRIRKLRQMRLFERIQESSAVSASETEKLKQVVKKWLLVLQQDIATGENEKELIGNLKTAQVLLETYHSLRLNLNKRLTFDNLMIKLN